MKILHLCCLLLISIFSLESNAQELSKVDSIIDTYPKTFINPKRLSERICFDFSDPTERVRAIYAWEAKNVKYNVKALYSKKKARRFKYNSREEKIRKENNFQNKLANRTLSKYSSFL